MFSSIRLSCHVSLFPCGEDSRPTLALCAHESSQHEVWSYNIRSGHWRPQTFLCDYDAADAPAPGAAIAKYMNPDPPNPCCDDVHLAPTRGVFQRRKSWIHFHPWNH